MHLFAIGLLDPHPHHMKRAKEEQVVLGRKPASKIRAANVAGPGEVC